MKMKIVVKILRVLLAIEVFCGLGFIVGTVAYDSWHPYNKAFSNRREMDGTILSTTENLTEIVTDDGNVWQIENFPCLVGTRCTVTFSTQKTDDPIDDVITNITTYTSFN